jgi:hyaluronate lyase
MGPSKVGEYAASPGVTVLENSDSAHAVRENLLNITGVNFWRDAQYTSSFITCDRKASIMVRETKDTIEAAISDPAWADEGEMKIKLDIAVNKILSKDDRLTAVLSGSGVSLSLDLKGLKGRAVKITFER